MTFRMDQDGLEKLKRRAIPRYPGSEMIFALFRTDPEAVRRILPRPLTPTSEPLGVAFVAHYPETNWGPTYSEGALFLRATHGAKVGVYCLAMPVDDDMAMVAGREIHGFPKKMAEEITLRREGDRVVGRVVRKGAEILAIHCDLVEPATDSDMALLGPLTTDLEDRPCALGASYLYKFSMSTTGRSFDYLPRLVRQVTLFTPRDDTMKGPGTLTLTSSPHDPLGEVPVLDTPLVLHGTFDNTMLPGRVVARAWNPLRFLPHALFKSDFYYEYPDAALSTATPAERKRLQRRTRSY